MIDELRYWLLIATILIGIGSMLYVLADHGVLR